jgi:ribosomal protein S6--L-glutamate ligase
MPRIGVIGNHDGWSSLRLAEAVQEATGDGPLFDPAELTLDLVANTVRAGERDLAGFDALLVKKIGQGYRPHYLDRLEMLRLLEDRGVRVVSAPERILRVLDRLSCTVTLRRAGIPMAPTVVTESVEEAVKAVCRFGTVVAKPLWTSKARGMEVISAESDDVRARLEAFRAAGNHVFYLQERLELPGRDLGLTFLGGEFVGAYARRGGEDSWNTAVRGSKGAYEAAEPSAELVELARRAQAPFGLDFTGVDVAETERGPVVWEVSAFGGFRGLWEGCGIDVAPRFVDWVRERIR